MPYWLLTIVYLAFYFTCVYGLSLTASARRFGLAHAAVTALGTALVLLIVFELAIALNWTTESSWVLFATPALVGGLLGGLTTFAAGLLARQRPQQVDPQRSRERRSPPSTSPWSY